MSTPIDVLRQLVERVSSDPNLLANLTKSEKSFQFRPPDGQPFFLAIKRQSLEVSGGEVPNPTATIIASSQDLVDVFSGKADPSKLFFSGKLRVQGNVLEAQELARLLGTARS
ncbi:MAG: SCP2 sterol-binding domain-containing protein [Thaumarchaeota archaeon]|nr:SCP2 sterol-binding domain-containing protein [Candidatus Calditenuaceae archaeon]MDW8187039.1 SCP2 sterol-binding domain-containing protein [Nitrososphaerota archaeon]